jgi:AraC-like DNA-binding protein
MQKEKIYQLGHIDFSASPLPDLHLQMCGTTYPNRNYSIHRPVASIACIEYIVSGTGTVWVDGEQFSPVAGDTYFLPAGISHDYFSDKRDPWEKIWINVSGELAERLAALYRVSDTHYYPALDTSDLLLKFQYYAEHPDTENLEERCISLLNSLFCRMARSLYAPRKSACTPVERMLDYISRHETDVIRIEQLADVCERSPSQAERLFRKEMGIPPYRYVLDRKLALAKQLLRETGMPIRDIASYLSFEDEFYFSGLFRRKVGVSPSKYRKGEE